MKLHHALIVFAATLSALTLPASAEIAGSSNANFNVFSPGDVPGAAQALGTGATVPYTITFDIR